MGTQKIRSPPSRDGPCTSSLWAERWGKEVAAIQVGAGETKASFLWILEHMQRPNYIEQAPTTRKEREIKASQWNMTSAPLPVGYVPHKPPAA